MTISADQTVVARDTIWPKHSRVPPRRSRTDRTAGRSRRPLVEEVKTPNRHYKQRFCLATAFVGLVSMLFLVWMIVSGASRMRDILDNVVQLLAGLVAVAVCAGAARRSRQRCTGWALLTASLFLTQCGNAIWFYYDILRGEPVSASLAAEICIGLALPLAVAAMLTFPGALGTVALTPGTARCFDEPDGDVLHRLDARARPRLRPPIGRAWSPRYSIWAILSWHHGRVAGHHPGHPTRQRNRTRLGLVSAGLLSFAGDRTARSPT